MIEKGPVGKRGWFCSSRVSSVLSRGPPGKRSLPETARSRRDRVVERRGPRRGAPWRLGDGPTSTRRVNFPRSGRTTPDASAKRTRAVTRTAGSDRGPGREASSQALQGARCCAQAKDRELILSPAQPSLVRLLDAAAALSPGACRRTRIAKEGANRPRRRPSNAAQGGNARRRAA